MHWMDQKDMKINAGYCSADHEITMFILYVHLSLSRSKSTVKYIKKNLYLKAFLKSWPVTKSNYIVKENVRGFSHFPLRKF